MTLYHVISRSCAILLSKLLNISVRSWSHVHALFCYPITLQWRAMMTLCCVIQIHCNGDGDAALLDLGWLNIWNGTDVVLSLDEQFVRLLVLVPVRLNLKTALISSVQYSMRRTVISLSCTVQIHYNDGSVSIFAGWLYGTGVVLAVNVQAVRLYFCLCAWMWSVDWLLVFDEVWGRKLIYTLVSINTLQWWWRLSALSVLNISWNGYRVDPGQTGSTFALLPCACALAFDDVIDALRCITLWGCNSLTLIHCRSNTLL